MLKLLRSAFQTRDIRSRLIYTFGIIWVVRFGSLLPTPGVNTSFISEWIAQRGLGDAFNFFNAMTGGSFESLSILAMGVSPYITSSIIMQLLTIAIPALEELQKDGEEGRKRIQEWTRYVTVALALVQSLAMSLGFGSSGYFITYNWQSVVVCVATMTAGSAFLMWCGERVTENGIGNGISIILSVGILSRIPTDFMNLYTTFIWGQPIPIAILAVVLILAVILAMVIFVIILQDGERKIPVQYSQKTQGRKNVGGQASHIPLKVNTAGVYPVIFASSLMQFPVIISSFLGSAKSGDSATSIVDHIMRTLTYTMWLKPGQWWYSIGLIIYIALIIGFAYFYTSVTFNPIEIADNMKKQGGFVPGIRPGKPTSEYLSKILHYIIFVGAIGLIVISVIPIVFSGLFNAPSLSFSGTSLIIIVGVVLETLKQIESLMVVRSYKGFLDY
ncbi:protein translocase subunit SecY [Clostridia bacterium]|nr:protein translocase subunit SecY [Clostridia bacterium]